MSRLSVPTSLQPIAQMPRKKKEETSESDSSSEDEAILTKKTSFKKKNSHSKKSKKSSIESESSSEEEVKKKNKFKKKPVTSSSEEESSEEDKKPKKGKKKKASSSDDSSSDSDVKSKKKQHKKKGKKSSSSEESSSESSSESDEKPKKRSRNSRSKADKMYEENLRLLQEQFAILKANCERSFQAKLRDYEIIRNREMTEFRRQREKFDEELTSVAKLRQELEERKFVFYSFETKVSRKTEKVSLALTQKKIKPEAFPLKKENFNSISLLSQKLLKDKQTTIQPKLSKVSGDQKNEHLGGGGRSVTKVVNKDWLNDYPIHLADPLQEFLPDWMSPHEKKVREILLDPDRYASKKIELISQLTGCTNDMKIWMNELVQNELFPDLNYIPNSWAPETFNAFMLGLSQMVPRQAERFVALYCFQVVNKDWPGNYGIHLVRKRLEEKGAKNEETPILQNLSLSDTVGRKSGDDNTPMEVDPQQSVPLQEFLPDWMSPHEKKVREILFDPDRYARKKIDQINQLTGCTNDMKIWMNELVQNEFLPKLSYIPNSWTPETFNAFMLGLSKMSRKQAERFFTLYCFQVVNKDWPDDYVIHLARKRLEEKGAKSEETPILQNLSLRDAVGRKSDEDNNELLRTAKAELDKEMRKDPETSRHQSRFNSLINPESQRQENSLKRNSIHQISIESDPHQDEGDPIDTKRPKEARIIGIVEKLPPFKFKALPKQSNKAVKVTKPPEESKPIESKKPSQHREASLSSIPKKEDGMPRRTPSTERKIEEAIQQYNLKAMTEPSTSKNTLPPCSIIEPLCHDTRPIVLTPSSVVPNIQIAEERPLPGGSSFKEKKKVEEVGEDVVNRIDHSISTLTKGQLFWLLAALVSTLARIIADTIKTKMEILEQIASLKFENDKKRNIIRSYCEECKCYCPGDDFSYDGICKKEYCKHRIQFHKTAEKNRESIITEIATNNHEIKKSESDLIIIETELQLLQDTCIDFSLFRIADKSDFPKILVEELSEISNKEGAKITTTGFTQTQKSFYCNYSTILNDFSTTFQEKLMEGSTSEYIGSIINSTVIERILQLMSLENGGEEIKARVENYIETKKLKLYLKPEVNIVHRNTKEEQASDHYATAEEVEEIEIINASLPSEVNIILLGGTSVGKSTFINAIANMLSHRNLDEAKMEVRVLIKTAFHFIEPDTNIEHKIIMEPTIAIGKQGEVENENAKVGESCTKLPKFYVFKYGRPGFERTIRIIDTPGVGDTNGVEQDRENFHHIINFASSFREIHAFLFVLKPNDARLELQFRYCIKELLTHLHVSATENIIFCMTNGKGTNYKPGETFGTLQTLLNTIKEERNIEIRLQERCLVFDNEFYRYLCEVQHDMKHTEMEIKNHHESWTRGKNELSKMMKMIANLTPHDVNNTLSVTKVRRAIEIMSKPLAELSKNLLINIGLIEDKQEEIQECLNKGEDFKDRLFTRQIQMNTEELDDPMTVCGHPECSKREPLHEGGVEEIVYGDPCHDKCYLQNIAPGEPPGEAIKSCEIFVNTHDEYTCSVCGHSYEDHLHMRYKLVREVIMVIDLEVQRAIVENNDRITVANLFLERKREEIHALERNLDRKQTICAHFAIFLKDNSVLAYNDQYMAYMNGLIREERERVQRGSNEETLNRLETCQFQYIELKKAFENPTNGRKMTLIEIEDLIEEIKKMDNGDIIKDIHNLEIIYPARLAFDSPPIPIKQSNISLLKYYENWIKQIFNPRKSQSKKGKKY